MDPSSVCRLHPGVAVTGFCPACLRDRLAGLQPSSCADLRRCKSFSYARSAASQLEPQRRSCDLFRQQEQQPVMAVPEEEEEEEVRRMEAEEPSRKSSFGALLGKKLQQWRRKKTKEPPPVRPETTMMPSRRRQHSFRDLDGQRSCDQLDPASCMDDAGGSSGPMTFDRLMMNPAMLSVEEEDYITAAVPRSDGQIPVEEDYYDNSAVPGGCAQTRDYYLDSSSSSRRRRSTSARNSFSDVVNSSELPTNRMAMASNNNNNANSRVSPAIAAAEFYHAHHQSLLVHHHQYHHHRDWNQPGSGRFDSAFRTNKQEASKPKRGIKGWSIWGLIQKKSSSSRKSGAAGADHGSLFSSEAAAAPTGVGDHPWPELRARGYNGQMLRCNSSISARSSFSGGAAMIGGSARRSVSGLDLEHDVHGSSWRTTRRDEVLLERNLSTRSSYSRSGQHDHPMLAAAAAAAAAGNYQFSRLNHKGEVRSSKSKPSALHRKSTLGPYSTTDPVPRQ